MKFEKDRFIDQLFGNVFPNDPIKQKAKKISDRGVYSGGSCMLKKGELDKFENYRRFLKEWNFTKSTGGDDSNEDYKVYCLNPLRADSIRKMYNDNSAPKSLEGIVSLCLACDVHDFDYINEACRGFCEETLEGKGLRKILIYGAAKGFVDFDEIAYNSISGSFGLLEQYYDRSLYERCEAYDRTKVPRTIQNGTVNFLENVNDCKTREDFMKLLDNEDIREGFLYDKIELIMIIQDCLDKRRATLCATGDREGDNALFKRYGAKGLQSTYSRLCHGHKPRNDFFLSLALTFGFSDSEIDNMARSMHINAASDGGIFSHCCELVKDINRLGVEENDSGYIVKFNALADFVCKNKKSLPDFDNFLEKFGTEPL